RHHQALPGVQGLSQRGSGDRRLRGRGVPRVKLPVALLLLVVAGALVVALTEAAHLGGQMALRASGRFEDEIHWLDSLEPLRVWDPGRHEQIDRRYHDWVERELRGGRLDR